MITGAVTTSAIMALIAAFIVQGFKQILNEAYHRFIPLPLGAVMVGVGVLLARLTGNNLVDGGLEGIVAAALAAYGYDMVKGWLAKD
jgi:hypothetical protein